MAEEKGESLANHISSQPYRRLAGPHFFEIKAATLSENFGLDRSRRKDAAACPAFHVKLVPACPRSFPTKYDTTPKAAYAMHCYGCIRKIVQEKGVRGYKTFAIAHLLGIRISPACVESVGPYPKSVPEGAPGPREGSEIKDSHSRPATSLYNK